MSFIRLETSDGDIRWINLDLVSRATLGIDEAGVPLLAIIFSGGGITDSLKIHGTDELNRTAIERFVRKLDGHAVTVPPINKA